MKPQTLIFSALALIVLLALGVLTGIVPGLKERQPQPFTLTLWGFDDDPAIWEDMARLYHEELEAASLTYIAKDSKTYEAELLNELAAGRGPDVFLLPGPWLGRYGDKIAALPDGELGYQKRSLKSIFADSAASAVTDERGVLLGTPLALDTLALFYNRDHLNAANISNPPATWEEFTAAAQKLTRLSAVGGIQRSGAALGTASNVEHAGDILLALIYQSDGQVLAADGRTPALKGRAAESALEFYTAFAQATKKSYSWNAFFDNSLTAFAAGEAAMAFGYARDAPEVVLKNPQLNFDIAPLPQPAGAGSAVSIGRLNLMGVARTSGQERQAWRFLLWLQGKNAQKAYAEARGLPPARRDLVNLKPPREYLIPFYDQVLSARLAPTVLADSLDRILGDMIEGVISRRFDIGSAIARAEEGIADKLRNPPQ